MRVSVFVSVSLSLLTLLHIVVAVPISLSRAPPCPLHLHLHPFFASTHAMFSRGTWCFDIAAQDSLPLNVRATSILNMDMYGDCVVSEGFGGVLYGTRSAAHASSAVLRPMTACLQFP
jgi:hypothetical protein